MRGAEVTATVLMEGEAHVIWAIECGRALEVCFIVVFSIATTQRCNRRKKKLGKMESDEVRCFLVRCFLAF